MNRQNIIKSIKTGRRKPAAAFFMSLAVTGLGQIYTGRYSAGVALFLLRAVSEFIVPAYIHARPGNSSIDFFTAALIFNIIVLLISPFEALLFSLRNRETQLKQWNSLPVYAIFTLVNISLLTAGIAVNTAFFTVRAFPGEKFSIIFTTNDIVLVKKYTSPGPGRGDYILYNENGKEKTSRITGIQGDTIEISKRSLVLNSIPLKIGVPDGKNFFGREFTRLDDLYLETNGSITYPVKIDFSRNKRNPVVKIVKPGNGEFLVTDDNRKKDPFFRLIKREQIIGRIEGVIFSKKPERLLLKPFVSVHSPASK